MRAHRASRPWLHPEDQPSKSTGTGRRTPAESRRGTAQAAEHSSALDLTADLAGALSPPSSAAPAAAAPSLRRLRVGTELSVLCQGLDASGYGLATATAPARSGSAPELPSAQLRIPNLLPGERAYVKVVHVSPHVGRTEETALARPLRTAVATLVHRDTAAPERQIPACSAFGSCGGCTLQHLSYEAQLRFKHAVLRDQLASLGTDVTVAPCVASPQPLHYRSRVKLVAAPPAGTPARAGHAAVAAASGTERIILGAYAPRSHRVIDLDGCRVNTPVLRQLARTLSQAWSAAGLSVYTEQSGRGALRYVLLRAVHSGAVQVSLVVAAPPPREKLLAVVAALQAAHPQLASVVLHHNPHPGNALLTWDAQSEDPSRSPEDPPSPLTNGAERAEVLADVALLGSEFLDEELGVPDAPGGERLRLRVSARSFLQVNRPVASRIYADVAAALPAAPGETILDLYCGASALGRTVLAAAPQARLIGIESSPSAVADAEHSARAAGLSPDRAQFVCGSVEDLLPGLFPPDRPRPPLLVLINPPRRGCTTEVLRQILACAPRAIAYVSCSPPSLARDLSHLLAAGYALRRVTPYDMHPGTPHIETVALLERTAQHPGAQHSSP